MASQPGDGVVTDGLLGDAEIAAQFSSKHAIESYTAFELALLKALHQAGLVDKAIVKTVSAKAATFSPDIAAIADATTRDGVPVPEFVRQFRAHVGPPASDKLHAGATSQDLVDTALVIALGRVNDLLKERLVGLVEALDDLAERFGTTPLMGRTRMQAAVDISAAERIGNWRAPLQRHLAGLDELSPDLMKLQFGGPVGNRDGLEGKGEAVAERLARELGLRCPATSWHTQRDGLVRYATWLSSVTGALGKIGQDVCLMAQQGIDEIALSLGGTSSAMPHKHNPVQAEVLVSLARYNAVQVSGLHHSLVHELERSGSAWTLEWLILPQMCIATGAATRHALDLLTHVERIGKSPA